MRNANDNIPVLLVDDQEIIASGLKQMLSNNPEFVLHYCQDPKEAIKTAEALHPAVILQDLVMPEIDGLNLVKYFRALESTKDVPMIVLSSTDDAKIKAQAFDLGANDYLVKLPGKSELIARLKYHSKSYYHLIERNEAFAQLNASRKALQSELDEAAEYVRSQLPEPVKDQRIEANWRFIPSKELGGDSLGYHWLDENHLAIYLLDVCGHGVGPALLSCTINGLMRTDALGNTDLKKPSDVLKELNARFQMEQHHNMFFTLWYGVYSLADKQLNYSSGGHPPAILSSHSKQHQELTTPGTVVGGMPDLEFSEGSVKIAPGDRLYLYSDGIYEIKNSETGKLLTIADFIAVVEKICGESPELVESIDRILEFAKKTHGEETFPDDVSILGIRFLT
ncbi:MAG: SpoIIE family protein phosphatase [Chlamydiia bacterium]|nr:SpoIIE family protein phosphatase [Chlamydiia bacterium]